MDDLVIPKTDAGPDIVLDASGNVRISGRSILADASTYFQPALDWVDTFQQTRKQALKVEIFLVYFNSSTAKQLLRLLMMVDEADLGSAVVWKYPENHDILKERGEELADMLDLPFEYQPCPVPGT